MIIFKMIRSAYVQKHNRISDRSDRQLKLGDLVQLSEKLNTRPNGRVRYLLTSVLTYFDFNKRGKATTSRHWINASVQNHPKVLNAIHFIRTRI